VIDAWETDDYKITICAKACRRAISLCPLLLRIRASASSVMSTPVFLYACLHKSWRCRLAPCCHSKTVRPDVPCQSPTPLLCPNICVCRSALGDLCPVPVGIDIFAHRSGADRRGRRRGDICGSKTGSPAVKGNGILKMVLENGEGGVGQTVAAPMASWGEEATRLVRGCVPCGLHQL